MIRAHSGVRSTQRSLLVTGYSISAARRAVMPVKASGTKRKLAEGSIDPENKLARKNDSHLYTDDNPETTLHGTGFSDAAAAHGTIHLIRKRSLTYQFQVVNTMFHRAKHHPHPNARMQSAMDVFQEWLNEYKGKKQQATAFKTVKRPVVELCLKALDNGLVALADDSLPASEAYQAGLTWARIYVKMPTGKRLANTLTTTDPEQPDMDSLRTTHLQDLVPADSSVAKKQAWRLDEDGHRQLSDLHLRWLLFGYSPQESLALTCLQTLH